MTTIEMIATGTATAMISVFASAVVNMVAGSVVAHKASKIDLEFCNKAERDVRCDALHIFPVYTFYSAARLVTGAIFGFKGEKLSESDKEVVGLAVGLKPSQVKELA